MATSKYGKNYNEFLHPNVNKTILNKFNEILIFFGTREKGLSEFFNNKKEMQQAFDIVVNLFPNTSIKSIRLEESIPIALFFVKNMMIKK